MEIVIRKPTQSRLCKVQVNPETFLTPSLGQSLLRFGDGLGSTSVLTLGSASIAHERTSGFLRGFKGLSGLGL